MGMQQLKLEQYRAEKGLPAGLEVDNRCRIPEVIAVSLLEVQPTHVIGDRHLGCIGAPGCPLGALHAAWPPVRAAPVLGRRLGDNLCNQSACAPPFARLCVSSDPRLVRGEGTNVTRYAGSQLPWSITSSALNPSPPTDRFLPSPLTPPRTAHRPQNSARPWPQNTRYRALRRRLFWFVNKIYR